MRAYLVSYIKGETKPYMDNKANIQHNKLMQLGNSMLMYSVYNAETLEKLITTVHNIHNSTSSHERISTLHYIGN